MLIRYLGAVQPLTVPKTKVEKKFQVPFEHHITQSDTAM